MKTRPWLLPVFLGATLAMIYFLPAVGEVAQSAVNMELPAKTADWQLEPIPASEAEIATLAKDTQFSKAVCLRGRPGEWNELGQILPDRIDLSVVLSGSDLNNSIHRPERCMPAQGHNILSSRDVEITLEDGKSFTARRLLSIQSIPLNPERTQFRELNCITYYFFVGHDRILHDHLDRTFVDMKDRLLRGMDQRWAYASASMWFGELEWLENEVTEEEADQKLRAFLADFAKTQINWDQMAR